VRRANRLFDQAHAQFNSLRESEEGRAGIAALMQDPNPYIALMAAAHSLLWTPEPAIAVLEALEDSEGLPVVQTSAEYTLIEWREGNLSFDW